VASRCGAAGSKSRRRQNAGNAGAATKRCPGTMASRKRQTQQNGAGENPETVAAERSRKIETATQNAEKVTKR